MICVSRSTIAIHTHHFGAVLYWLKEMRECNLCCLSLIISWWSHEDGVLRIAHRVCLGLGRAECGGNYDNADEALRTWWWGARLTLVSRHWKPHDFMCEFSRGHIAAICVRFVVERMEPGLYTCISLSSCVFLKWLLVTRQTTDGLVRRWAV